MSGKPHDGGGGGGGGKDMHLADDPVEKLRLDAKTHQIEAEVTKALQQQLADLENQLKADVDKLVTSRPGAKQLSTQLDALRIARSELAGAVTTRMEDVEREVGETTAKH